ncbi:hypothetical protein TERMP_00011 [Thermococcus barophilus MP]|uniref:Uncharacterized protein n=1 Tax=Thermococcus barophilus (strain DSM 11836 / MP) TaxID=391623 RepID=F0LGV0_THEBM|nr:hypothetical protein TERMP_00011 [Thermococcus barophilus MP]
MFFRESLQFKSFSTIKRVLTSPISITESWDIDNGKTHGIKFCIKF